LSYQPRRSPRVSQIALRGKTFQISHWEGTGESPWVWLHGFADVGQTFQFVIDASRLDHAGVAMDFRGFGGSEWSCEPYWFADYLADLDAWLSQCYPNQALNLIGHSMGGHVAMMYAGIRPERVRKLVNIDGVGLADSNPAEAPSRYRQWLDELRAPTQFSQFDSQDQLQSVLMHKNPRLGADHARYIANLWAKPVASGFTINADPFHKMVNPVLYRRAEFLACWRAITAPVLMVLGSESFIIKRFTQSALLDEIKTHLPHAQLEILQNVGHMIQHEAIDELARLVDDFLRE